MAWIWTCFWFVIGLVFGSFFNVVGLRVPKNESIVYPNSYCDHCKRELSWFEKIPVLSWIFLRSRCRTCHAAISPIYPVMEFLTGFLFAFSYDQLGWHADFIIALFLISLLVIITVSDLVYMLIPDRVLVVFLIVFILLRMIAPLEPWWDAYLAAFLGFGILYFLATVSKGGMGGGDIKLFFVLGLILGTKATLMTLFLASFIGMVFGLVQMIRKKIKRKNPIPFGPFISIGAIISYFYTDVIIQWYIEHFLFSFLSYFLCKVLIH